MVKDVFIAAPLFNLQQHAIIDRIEQLCSEKRVNYYSARIDSEPFVPKGEDKKNPRAWDGVFNNNEEGLVGCSVMIAVLNYAMPEGDVVAMCKGDSDQKYVTDLLPQFRMEMPDSGTVFEMGYFRALGKYVIGFHPEKCANHLNVMLTHGCHGLISGWESLERFFQQPDLERVHKISEVFYSSTSTVNPYHISRALKFDWTVAEHWGAQNSEVAY